MKWKYKNKEFEVIDSKYNSFWEAVEKKTWEPETLNILEKYIKKDSVYVDIGAWIGPTVLVASQLANTCYAIEPDPVALIALKMNLQLNSISNTIIYEGAISNKSGSVSLGLQPNAGQLVRGNSMSSIVGSSNPENLFVNSMTLVDFLEKYNIDMKECSLIKIDIEGGEELVIPNIKDLLVKYTPTLYLSIHPKFFTNSNVLKDILDCLTCYKYCYSNKGQLLTFDQLLKVPDFNELVLTQEEW